MTGTNAEVKPTRKKRVGGTKVKAGAVQAAPTESKQAVITLRPRKALKACAEAGADQIGRKRSQLDEDFYLTGVLAEVLKNKRTAPMIGTFTRRQAAEHLQGLFEPLFELLYQQDLLPIAHQLLIERGAAIQTAQTGHPSPVQTDTSSIATRGNSQADLPQIKHTAAFEGMPGGSDGF